MTDETQVKFAGLLPEPDQSVHCNVWAREISIDPAGTAIAADQILLVEAPLPWPKPATDHAFLAPLMDLIAAGATATKVLASAPRGYAAGIRMTRYVRDGGGATRSVYEVDDIAALTELVASLVGTEDAPPAPAPIDEHEPPTHAVLICTQGSHDVCCGADGTRFAMEVEDAFPDVEVHRVSHTGGHRFAPTALTLPDGRMWAHLKVESLAEILGQAATPAELAPLSRGWWGAARGPAQVAEQAVWATQDWQWANADRQVTMEETTAGTQCAVSSDTGVWETTVMVSREVPTIACRAPGGLPAKPGREYIATPLAPAGP